VKLTYRIVLSLTRRGYSRPLIQRCTKSNNSENNNAPLLFLASFNSYSYINRFAFFNPQPFVFPARPPLIWPHDLLSSSTSKILPPKRQSICLSDAPVRLRIFEKPTEAALSSSTRFIERCCRCLSIIHEGWEKTKGYRSSISYVYPSIFGPRVFDVELAVSASRKYICTRGDNR
jgi:hypothetical protein